MVYSARWKNSNTPVAVKVLQLFGVTLEEIQKGARAITNELVVLNTVRHPSVIHVYGVVVTSDAHTPGCAAVRIVMELAECSLQQLLTQTALMSTTSTTTTSTATSLMSSSSSYVPLSERSLESYSVASEIKLTLRIRLRIAESVASGLSHLHTARVPVVHRDLKPANILIRRQGDDVSACIADFGVALLDKTDMTLANPESYLPQGTLMYMVGVRGRRTR
jgi:serine/threonine protein kinase